MKLTQLFICAALMAAPVLYVFMTSTGSMSFEEMLEQRGGLPWLATENDSQPSHAANALWPPAKHERYPDLKLKDQNGDVVQLSDFEGKVILLELAAVPCGGCQAFAGGNERGIFAGGKVQKGLHSIHHYARQYAGVELSNNDDVVLVQLMLYGNSLKSPTQAEVTGWANHFGMDRNSGEIVLKGEASLLSESRFDMVPGFHLIDRDFVLAYDSTGDSPIDNLFSDLLPAMGQMVQ